MLGATRVRDALARRSWPIAAAPTRQLCVLFAVELLAALWGGYELVTLHATPRQWLDAALIVCLAIGFEETATRAARLRLRIGAELKQDLTSVWALAAAVALSPGLAVGVLVAIMTYTWARQQRPAGESLYGTVFNAADALVICLCAGLVARTITRLWADAPWGLATTMAVVGALVTLGIVNRLLVTVALMAAGYHGSVLIGSRNENLVEFATLCLGGLVAVAIVDAPWLAILVVAPLGALQRSALVHQFEEAATTDSKTGLLNAVAWEYVAEREIARAIRTEAPVAVAIIDIDRFKEVNDKFGHLAGDKVLKAVGQGLRAELREYDTLGRFGGEEFVAVLPGAGTEEALIAAERLRSRVSSLDLAVAADEICDGHKLSVSIGVAVLPGCGDNVGELLRAADAALYRAKASGRNRVMLADGGPERPSLNVVNG